MLSKEAKKAGLIDAIATPAPRADRKRAEAEAEPGTNEPTAAPIAAQPKGPRKMDLQTLKAQHPDVYAAAFAEGQAKGIEDGTTAGTAAERKRVSAHLKMADSTGATKVAHDAIRSGASVLDEEIHAEYVSAGLNRNAQTDRQEETDAAGTALEGAAASGDESQDLGDQVAGLMAAKLGKKL
jgi:hypothetical protein